MKLSRIEVHKQESHVYSECTCCQQIKSKNSVLHDDSKPLELGTINALNIGKTQLRLCDHCLMTLAVVLNDYILKERDDFYEKTIED